MELTKGAATGMTRTWRGDSQNGLHRDGVNEFRSSSEDQINHSPLPPEVFCGNTDKSLQAAKDRPMNHHRPVDLTLVLVRTAILQVEPLGKLEVELDGGALVGSFEGVLDRDVDLWAVECSVPWIYLPFTRLEAVESVAELLERYRSEGQL